MLEIDHVIAYLARNESLGITYIAGASTLGGYTDASWEVTRSTSGWTIGWQAATLCWGSSTQKCTALSSCEAEIIALSEGAKDMVYLRRLISGLNESFVPGPSPLRTDNTGARDTAYNPINHDRMKHVERRHYFVRDMVEAFEIEVPFVGTYDNLADFYTKPLEFKDFERLRGLIMNIPTGDARAPAGGSITRPDPYGSAASHPHGGRGASSGGGRPDSVRHSMRPVKRVSWARA